MSVVPITIREHLVPFFFKESEGEEHLYGNRRVKSVLFPANYSSIGKIIRLLMEKAGQPLNVDKYNLCLTVVDDNGKKTYEGKFYKIESGRNSFLKLPQKANEDINDLLEDIFRSAFISYIEGCLDYNDETIIVKAIDRFIEKYELLEFGFSQMSLRQVYYRDKKKDRKLGRFQHKKPVQFMHFM